MNVLSQAMRNLRNVWGQGEEEEQDFAAGTNAETRSVEHDRYGEDDAVYDSPGGGSGHGNSLLSSARRLRPVHHTSRSHEKNIYTLRPKNLDEAAIAADCLKTGSAVIINHEMVDRATSLRIIDFMSGVCYGLDQQGHAMKLGETIFLFTPGEFEISSDEADYGENREHFFKSESRSSMSQAVGTTQAVSAAQVVNPAQTVNPAYSRSVAVPASQVTSYQGAPHVERRSWER